MEPERIPVYSEEDMHRLHFDGPPQWINVLGIILLILLVVIFAFPTFAQARN